jgi:hypothetical protein
VQSYTGSMEARTDGTERPNGEAHTPEHPPPACPRCGAEVIAFGNPETPYYAAPDYCARCGAPLTAGAKARKELQRSSILNAIEVETAERVVERGAADLGIEPGVARRMVVRWAKRQP